MELNDALIAESGQSYSGAFIVPIVVAAARGALVEGKVVMLP